MVTTRSEIPLFFAGKMTVIVAMVTVSSKGSIKAVPAVQPQKCEFRFKIRLNFHAESTKITLSKFLTATVQGAKTIHL